MATNVRRAASSANGKISTSTGNKWNDGFSKRESLHQSYPFVVQKMINDAKVGTDTNTDGYLVMKFKTANTNSHVKAIETDTPPRLEMTSFASGRSGGFGVGNDLDLPYFATCEYMDTFPAFLPCMVSRVRYIEYVPNDRKNFVPGQPNNTVTPIDIFETYIQALHGTIDQYYRHPSDESASNIWRIAHTIRVLTSKWKSDKTDASIIDESLKNYDSLTTLIRNRDKGMSDATQYKKTVSVTNPFTYYYTLYNAMVMDHDIVHKSNFVQGDLLLGGLFLMNDMKNGASITGIEDLYLRSVYEKAVRCFTKENFNSFVTVDDFVKHLHENSGKKFHAYLKYSAFFVELYRHLFNGQEQSIGQTVQTINEIKKHLRETDGINLLSHIISPSCRDYLSDEQIAEFILRSCTMTGGEKKFSKLETSMFSTYNESTSLIHKTIRANLEAISKAQDDIARIEATIKDQFTIQSSVDSDLESDDEPTISLDQVPSFLDNYCSQLGSSHHHNPSESRRFKMELAAIVKSDIAIAPLMIQKLVEEVKEMKSMVLGPRRIYKIVRRSCIEGGNVHDWLQSIGKERLEGNMFSSSSVYHYASKYTVEQVTGFKQIIEDEKDDIVGDNFQFVKFESALANNVAKFARYVHQLGLIREECVICCEPRVLTVQLHGEPRHRICVPCRDTIVRRHDPCPFCREPLSV